MKKEQPAVGEHVDQKHAETLARLFNIAYNGAVLYGGAHQTTADSAVPLLNYLSRLITGEFMVSILAERDSVYIENFCVDKIINARRLLLHFRKVGLQSITFSKDVTLDSVRSLLKILSDLQAYPNAEAMQKGLTVAGCEGIRLNYVVYRKMTTDDAVVNKDAASQIPEPPQDTSVARQVIDGLSEVMAAKQAVDGPAAVGQAAAGASGAEDTRLSELLDRLRTMYGRSKDSPLDGGGMSGRGMVDAVVKLNKEVADNLDVIRKTHHLNEADNLVIGEIDAMSHEVVLRLLCEEYKAGGVSTRRLAQITRRMMPDVKELKRMLPRLKVALLKEGMPQADYLAFVTEILKDLESDGLSGVFEPAVKEMGISMDELVESIRADPADAARLIVLASEIRKSSKQDDTQLSTLLTDYIEKVSRSLTLDSKDVAQKDGIHLLKSTIGKIEADLVERLKNHGIPQPVLDRASQMLRSRLDGTVNGARREWANRFVASLGDLDETELLLMFRDLHQNENDTAVLREPFVSLLKEKNRSEEQIAQFFDKARVAQAKQQQELPKGVLNVNATLYFLEREIKRHQRYNTPFSSVIVTVPAVSPTPGALRSAGEREHRNLMPQILVHLRRVLRDLDIVGSLGLVSGDVPFIVLPMTEGPGAATVVERLKRELGAKVFECDGERINGVFAISHSSFDKTKMTGYRSFLELALSLHRKQEKEVAGAA